MTLGRGTDEDTRRFHAAVAALQARGRFGVRLGLGRTRALLRVLDAPHRAIPGVLIGGTNGKGSVQAMVASVLLAGGFRVGQTPKPHLESYRERIVVDGRHIAPADLADLVDRVLRAADEVPHRLGDPTEFELLTAAAFDWFGSSGVDIAVVEVGLGGRLDATNVWDGGVAAITNVGLDHTEHLGPTLTDIGREKAAIIKRGDLAVSGAVGEGAVPIRRRARRMAVPLAEVAPLALSGMDREGITIEHPVHGSLRVGLLGRHQAANAGVAVAIIEALDRAGIASVGEATIREGLAAARWPGRLELIRTGDRRTDVLLDGAHNVDGARALAAALDDLGPLLAMGPATLLMAALRDKDVKGMVRALLASRVVRGATVVATNVPDAPRSMDAAELAAMWRAGAERSVGTGGRRRRVSSQGVSTAGVLVEPDVDAALEAALASAAEQGGPLVVCGSLYLVGAVRARLVDDPGSHDPPPRRLDPPANALEAR